MTQERLKDLEEVGVTVGRSSPTCSEEERGRLFRFEPQAWQRVILGVAGAMGTLGAFAVAVGVVNRFHVEASPNLTVLIGVVLLLGLVLCVVAMMSSTVCDLKARVIPLEACIVIAVCGVTFQTVAFGPTAVVHGALCALGVGAVCSLANGLYRIRSPTDAIGRGDVRCMVALSLASGGGSFFGLAACYACAALFAIAGCLLRRLKAKDGVPMAPFLAVWLVCGVAVGVVGP